MNNQFNFSFQTNESVVGKTHFIGGHKHLCCSYIRSGFAPVNYPFPHLLVPDDNSILANSIINNPDGGDFFTIPFSDLKFCPSFLKKGSPIQDAFLVKNTNRVKKITEKELGSFQIITFKVLNQKKIKESAPGTYQQELEIEPFSLGIEGLPEISKIIFSFGYGQSLESTPDSLMKTKLYNSKLLTESVDKTFTMKVRFWNIGDIDNKSDSVLTFSGSKEFDVDSLQEKLVNHNPDRPSNNPSPPNQHNNDSTTPEKGNKGLIIGGVIVILVVLVLTIGFLVVKKKKKNSSTTSRQKILTTVLTTGITIIVLSLIITLTYYYRKKNGKRK